MYEQRLLLKGETLYFCAERINRESTFKVNADKYKKLFGLDIYDIFDVQFLVYNTARTIANEKIKFVLIDEAHEIFTLENHKFLANNEIQYLIGLTATPKLNLQYEHFTKSYYYDKYCPIVYTVGLKDSYDLGLQRDIIFYRFNKSLSIEKLMVVKTKAGKTFNTSEVNSYLFWDKKIANLKKQNAITEVPRFQQNIIGLYLLRKKILYNLPSKAITYNTKIVHRLEGKTLVFANSLDLLKSCQISHILSGKNRRKTKKMISENQEYINMFDNNEINILGSYKIVEQGENLETFDNMVILSYDSKMEQFIQRIGRARNTDKPLKLIILATKNTTEMTVIDKLEKQLKIIKYNVTDLDEIKD